MRRTHDRALARRFCSSRSSSPSSLSSSSALKPSMSSSSDSQSRSSPFLLAAAFAGAAFAFPLVLFALLPAAEVPSCLARFGALGAGAAGPARSCFASAWSLRLPLRSGAPGWAFPPAASGVGSDCLERA